MLGVLPLSHILGLNPFKAEHLSQCLHREANRKVSVTTFRASGAFISLICPIQLNCILPTDTSKDSHWVLAHALQGTQATEQFIQIRPISNDKALCLPCLSRSLWPVYVIIHTTPSHHRFSIPEHKLQQMVFWGFPDQVSWLFVWRPTNSASNEP